MWYAVLDQLNSTSHLHQVWNVCYSTGLSPASKMNGTGLHRFTYLESMAVEVDLDSATLVEIGLDRYSRESKFRAERETVEVRDAREGFAF